MVQLIETANDKIELYKICHICESVLIEANLRRFLFESVIQSDSFSSRGLGLLNRGVSTNTYNNTRIFGGSA